MSRAKNDVPLIVIVDDQKEQAEWLENIVKEQCRQAEIKIIHTEYDFRECIAKLATRPPKLVLLDVMLRWTDPSPEPPKPPKDVQQEGNQTAGFRCERLLRAHKETEQVPVILFSVAEENDIRSEIKGVGSTTVFVSKSQDSEGLIQIVRRLLG